MEQHHDFTAEDKLNWLGEGEWVKEPDRVIFYHDDILCIVRRVFVKELSGDMFGGHLCGYCVLPKGHPWIGKGMCDIGAKVHWGLTYAELDIIGFDCAHSGDMVPSMKKLRAKYEMKEFKIPDSILEGLEGKIPAFMQENYRNLEFVMEECKSLAKQIKEVKCDT